jgi:hypothetical protein
MQQPTLLYQGTRDGFGAADFHSRCDGKGSTLTVVETSSGYVVGGYTNVSWNVVSRNYAKDGSSWIFALKRHDKKEPVKMAVAPGSPHTICCKNNYGPTFGGGHSLHVSNNANANGGSYMSVYPSSYPLPTGCTIKDLINSDSTFTVREIEVYVV